jgi:hypothetical protein
VIYTYILCICSFQLFVIRIYLFVLIYSLLVIHLFCSLFNYLLPCCLFSFLIDSLFIVVQKRKEQFWSWTVFRYFDPVVPVQVHLFIITNTSQQTSYSRLHRLCLSIKAKDLLPPKTQQDRRNQYLHIAIIAEGKTILGIHTVGA